MRGKTEGERDFDSYRPLIRRRYLHPAKGSVFSFKSNAPIATSKLAAQTETVPSGIPGGTARDDFTAQNG
jgi:hypothetical protein